MADIAGTSGVSNQLQQYRLLCKLIRKYGLSDNSAAEALIVFFHAPEPAFCKAVRFVWRTRNGRALVAGKRRK